MDYILLYICTGTNLADLKNSGFSGCILLLAILVITCFVYSKCDEFNIMN